MPKRALPQVIAPDEEEDDGRMYFFEGELAEIRELEETVRAVWSLRSGRLNQAAKMYEEHRKGFHQLRGKYSEAVATHIDEVAGLQTDAEEDAELLGSVLEALLVLRGIWQKRGLVVDVIEGEEAT